MHRTTQTYKTMNAQVCVRVCVGALKYCMHAYQAIKINFMSIYIFYTTKWRLVYRPSQTSQVKIYTCIYLCVYVFVLSCIFMLQHTRVAL